jgi:hypothetical protein
VNTNRIYLLYRMLSMALQDNKTEQGQVP